MIISEMKDPISINLVVRGTKMGVITIDRSTEEFKNTVATQGGVEKAILEYHTIVAQAVDMGDMTKKMIRYIAKFSKEGHTSYFLTPVKVENSEDPKESPKHKCGMCNGPLLYDGVRGGYKTWRCSVCFWLHTSKDCCE